MAYFLALDVGGTKTDYVLADESRTLARVRTGSIKRMRADAGTALAHLESALGQLSAESGVRMDQIAHTCVGTAGQTVPLVTDFLRSEIGARVGGDLLLLGDVEIALDAAFPGQAGILVLAGTGSNVAGRTAEGVLMTTGGWGPALSDQGSGHRIGTQALRAVALAHDEERETRLLAEVLRLWQLNSFDDLTDYANRLPSPDYSQLTHIVLECATKGDALAGQILKDQGEELAHIVRVLARRLRIASGPSGFAPQLAFAGSIMERVAPVREALIRAVQSEFPETTTLDGVIDPVEGALWRARNAHRGRLA